MSKFDATVSISVGHWSDEAARTGATVVLFDAPVLTAGSLSKVAWGGLRVGWVRAEPVRDESGRTWTVVLGAERQAPLR